MNNFVLLEDGRKLPFSDLAKHVSQDVYFTETHFEIASFLAGKFKFPDVLEKKVFVNTIFFRSPFAKTWCALVYLIRENALKVKEIHSNHIHTIALSEQFLPSDIHVIVSSPPISALLPTKLYIRTILKVLINLFYRIFFIRKTNKTRYIRAWVDVSKHIYEEEFEDSRILIYPFILNLRRHFRFFYQCYFIDKSNITLCGLPYKLKDIVVLLKGLSSKDEQLLTTVESRAYRQHASELLELGLKRIYTTDEFDAVGIALNHQLMKGGAHTTNTAHGIGVYMPFVAYNDFFVFNQAQKSYYSKHSLIENYFFRDKQNSEPVFSGDPTKGFQPAFVYLFQPYLPRQSFEYECDTQDRLIKSLQELALKLQVPFYIKSHPNQSEKSKEELHPLCSLVCNRWQDIPVANPIFFHLNSTAYYDLYKKGPVLTYKSKFLFPDIYFGKKIKTISDETVETTASKLLVLANWQEHVASQIEISQS